MRLAVTPKRSNYRGRRNAILTGDFDPFACKATERELYINWQTLMAEFGSKRKSATAKSNEGRKGFRSRATARTPEKACPHACDTKGGFRVYFVSRPTISQPSFSSAVSNAGPCREVYWRRLNTSVTRFRASVVRIPPGLINYRLYRLFHRKLKKGLQS